MWKEKLRILANSTFQTVSREHVPYETDSRDPEIIALSMESNTRAQCRSIVDRKIVRTARRTGLDAGSYDVYLRTLREGFEEVYGPHQE